MEIVNFNTLSETQRTQAAQMLTDELPDGWPTLAEAMDEIEELTGNHASVRFTAVDAGEVIGWAGLLPGYGKMFELHPLVVRSDWQRKGIGTALLHKIMDAAKEKGGLTLLAGSGDEKPGGETSMANVDLYEDLPRHIAEFEPGTHQTAFYLKYGFKIIGVVPDVYGIGKPDIQMAIRL
ncbi:MAG: GNAT family N-acetyltransferase [Oscillospiraceae bacterium]|nr:GNAT family N-acetyltransferase [Oscillospiraceae bacterium]